MPDLSYRADTHVVQLPEETSGRAEIGFKPLSRADFPLLRSWLDEPLVRRWWNHDSSCDVASIDYLIGEPAYRGRGWGAAMIASFVRRLWAALPDATQVVVPVAAANRASWRALERAGFARLAEGELEPDNPIDPRDHVVYAMMRPVGA